jgi:subtilase family serine protease
MKRRFIPVLALLVLAAFASSAQALPHSSAQGLSHRNACGVPAADSARCFAKVVTRDDGSTFTGPADTSGLHPGWSPADLQNAYKLPAGSGGPTVAIVDAFDDPNAESDLATYRAAWGLPPCTSSGSNLCFTKINQNGGTTPPKADAGWAEEIALDLDMVSAACPNCRILLVEANSNSFADLMAAVDRAAGTAGVVAISNSYGANEFSSGTLYDSHFNHPGIAITVSSGDSGYGPEYPAASRYVTATGGTSLSTSTSAPRGWSESAWSGAGSGCSSYETKPSWQSAPLVPTTCSRRTIADVSSVSNPNTGVAVYNTYAGDPGWMVFGGTSAAAPFIAGVYAVGGVAANTQEASLPYAHSGSLFDVTSGSNGRCVTGRNKNSGAAYLCTAGTGYDGPTGLGTPNGASAF